ncbi:MAG: hypothetical protein WCL23_02560 [Candidatus Moraniibacteriota bacterium]
MEYSLVPFLRKYAGIATYVGLAFAAIGFISLFVFGPKYTVRTDYLISQQDAQTKDYYTLTRSAEYMSKVLTEVVPSERFIAAVIDTGKTDEGFLPQDKLQKLNAWKKMVRVDKRLDLGIISVSVSENDLRSAQKVSQGISQVITDKNGAFLGTGDQNVPVSILTGPLAEQNPSLSKILIAAVAGFFGGFLVTLLYSFSRIELKAARGTAFRSAQ